MEDRLLDPHELPPVLQTPPYLRVMPFARIRERALHGEKAGFFDPEVLGFTPMGMAKDGDDTARWAVVEGALVPLLDTDDAQGLADRLAKAARPMFGRSHCKVVVTVTKLARLERHIADVMERCRAEQREFQVRPGDRKEFSVVPKGAAGHYPEEPFLLAAQIVCALRDRLENATLTGEETVDGALLHCQATIAVQSDPPGFVARAHPDVLAIGLAFSL